MKTNHLQSIPSGILRAADLLRAGEAIAIPTETVYGLAANALCESAVAKIFAAKGRPADNPLIVHVLSLDDIAPLVKDPPSSLLISLSCFMPGPLTVVLPKSDNVPKIVSGGLNSVAIRIPAHPVARAVLAKTGLPLAAPSANRSGSPSPTRARHVLDDMNGRIAAVLDGGECSVGVESTVLSLTDNVPEILRPGAVTAEQLRDVLGDVRVAQSVLSALEEGQAATSPGMKYRHYAPQAQVILLRGDSNAFARWCNTRSCVALCFAEDVKHLHIPYYCYGARKDYGTQARLLFDALRTLDELAGVSSAPLITAHAPEPEGVGLAVYNRLLRAAEFQVMDL